MDQEFDQVAWILLNHKAVEDMTILLYNNSPFYLRPQTANHLILFIETQGVQHVTIKETKLQLVQQQLQHDLARKPDWLPPAVEAVPIIVQ
jgi:translation initiation factor 2 gamma subunit (eIF-2gamma)